MNMTVIKEKGSWTVLTRTGEVFQDGFESKQDALDFIAETFG